MGGEFFSYKIGWHIDLIKPFLSISHQVGNCDCGGEAAACLLDMWLSTLTECHRITLIIFT